MGLLRGVLLVAALTPLGWIGALIVMRWMRQTGLVGPGLDELFDQGERYAWAIGLFLALLGANLLSEVSRALPWGVVVIALLVAVCWGVLRLVRGRS